MKRCEWMAVCYLSILHGAVYAQGPAPASGPVTFKMTWQAGGAGRRENMNVGSRRVYEIELQDAPPQGAEGLAAPGTRYGVAQFADEGHSSFVCGLRKPPPGQAGYESFFIDVNHSGSLEKGEILPAKPVFEGLSALEFGAVDLTLHGTGGPRKHRIYVHLNKFGPLYIASHCYMQGRLTLGDRQVEAVLLDYNCDGRYASGEVREQDIGSLGPRELDYDLIGWDADGDGKIKWREQHYIGSYAIQGGRVYRLDCSSDGLTVTVAALDLPMGRLQMPGQNAFVTLIGPLGPFSVLMPDGTGPVPAGTYQVEYALVYPTPDMSGEPSFRKSGQYFEKPWTICAGQTTAIEPNELIVTAADEQRMQAKAEERERQRLDPPVQSLLHTPLGDLSQFGVHLERATDQRILLCFFDAGQRPSRHSFAQLLGQHESLRKKNVVVAAVNVTSPTASSVQEWLAAQNAPFAVGVVKSEPGPTRLEWGLHALPWLILTDRQHIVVAEGSTLEEVARKITEDTGNPRNTDPPEDTIEPNAADLVREVRASEDWLHRIDSLQFRVEGTWLHPPESIAARRAELKRQDPNSESDPRHDFTLRPSATDSLEYAIDFVKQRLRYVENGPTGNHFLQIWDGQQSVSHIRHADGYEQYSLDLSREPLDRIFGSLSWPRAQPHSFWWAPEDVEKNMSFFGRPQDFRRAGQATYRGVSCDVLEFDPTHAPGQTFRWYVGCHDHLLYGRVEGFIENWTLDYQELAPKRWIPMTQGYAIREYDSQRKEYYIDVQREARIVGVRVNEALPETLFQMEWKEGIDVADRRSGETVWSKYVAVLPSLVGQPLPDLATLGIDPAREQIAGRSMLLCFCDMNQRPSRHGLAALAPQAEKLKNRGVVVLILQAVESEETAWAQPAGESELPWPVRPVKGDARKVRLTWGVRSLPWLILTDNRHAVTAEGFPVNELDDKLQGLENSK